MANVSKYITSYRTPRDIISRWKTLPKSATHEKGSLFRNLDTGEISTRRALDDIRAQSVGFRNSAEYQRHSRAVGGLGGPDSTNAQEYWFYYNRMLDLHGNRFLFFSELQKRNQERTFQSLWRAVQQDRENMKPGGPWARMLEYIGMREPGATYDVGDTPKVRHN